MPKRPKNNGAAGLFATRQRADLGEVADYIARDNPARAISFIEELREHCAAILAAPASYAPREELGPGVRMMVHGRYLVLFRANAELVRIERILHSARRRPRSV